jgi:hypothetical protein
MFLSPVLWERLTVVMSIHRLVLASKKISNGFYQGRLSGVEICRFNSLNWY